MLHLLLHGTFPYCLDTYESCMSHVITFSETISPSMLKIHREKERELECKQQILLHRPLAVPKMERFIRVIIHHCLKSLCEEDNRPQGAHSRNRIGAHTHPFPSRLSPNKALSTCLLICMVPWSFSEVLAYRAVPINTTPELSINNLVWKPQAMSKPVHLWPAAVPLLCSGTQGLQSHDLLWGWTTFRQPLPCCPWKQEHGAGWPLRPRCGRDSTWTFWTSPLPPSLKTQENPQCCFLRPKPLSPAVSELDSVSPVRDRGGAAIPRRRVSGRTRTHWYPGVPGFHTSVQAAEWADPSCSAAADGAGRQAACLRGWAAELCSPAPTNEADLMSWLFLCISASLTWCSMLYRMLEAGHNAGPRPSLPPKQVDRSIPKNTVLGKQEETEPLFITEHCCFLSWNVAAFLI